MKKREPITLYTDEENERLLSLLKVSIPILETTNDRTGRNKVWKNMEIEFNKKRGESRPYRTLNCLKTRYYYLKSQALRYKGDAIQNPWLKGIKNIFDNLKSNPQFRNEHNRKEEDWNCTDYGSFQVSEEHSIASFPAEALSHVESHECDSAETSSQLHLEVKYPDYESDNGEPVSPSHMDDKNSHYECDIADPEYQTQHMEHRSFNYESENNDTFSKRKPVQEMAFNKLIGEKIQVVTMQKELVEDEIKEKKLKMCLIKKEHMMKKQIQKLELEKLECNLMLLKQELQHKQEMYQLEREEAQLRRDVLKRKLLFFQETEEC